jgi:hypothetical protein
LPVSLTNTSESDIPSAPDSNKPPSIIQEATSTGQNKEYFNFKLVSFAVAATFFIDYGFFAAATHSYSNGDHGPLFRYVGNVPYKHAGRRVPVNHIDEREGLPSAVQLRLARAQLCVIDMK